MTHKVLALIERASGGDECAATAAHLAVERNAGLILAVDPHQEPLKTLESELSHLVGIAAKLHVPTSTMLIDMHDAQVVVRAVCCNRVDLVVLEQAAGPTDVARATMADALHEADISVVQAR